MASKLERFHSVVVAELARSLGVPAAELKMNTRVLIHPVCRGLILVEAPGYDLAKLAEEIPAPKEECRHGSTTYVAGAAVRVCNWCGAAVDS